MLARSIAEHTGTEVDWEADQVAAVGSSTSNDDSAKSGASSSELHTFVRAS